MDFPKSITIEACENFIAQLQNDGIAPLQLPVDTNYAHFGGLSSAIQAVNSWVRVNGDNRKLILRPSSTKDVLVDIINRPHKFAAAMCAKSITVNGEPEADLRRNLNAHAKTAVEEQQTSPFGQQRGPLCWFAFVDHSSKGFDRNFYIKNSGGIIEPRQSEQFNAVIKAMVDKSMLVSGGAKPLSGETLQSIGRVFYELFLNTHEHGSRGETRNEWLRPGVRILYVNGINENDKGIAKITGNQPVLTRYVSSTKMHGDKDKKRFVELGIVDSGLGYCDRWIADHPAQELSENLTIADEYQIFRKCFQFHQTSTQDNNKGNGLPVVMDKLTKLGGFIRIRSGRLALYRDFIESPYRPNDECHFFDWKEGALADNNLTTMAACTGVSLTLLIPLEEK